MEKEQRLQICRFQPLYNKTRFLCNEVTEKCIEILLTFPYVVVGDKFSTREKNNKQDNLLL